MTKKEFKEAMIRGQGRCVLAVRREPEKYREIVLWACKRDIAYDTQSEGARSRYVYTLTCAYPDKRPFISAAAEALKKYRPNGSWTMLHLAELLMFFAMDGSRMAHRALVAKYRELLDEMLARKRRPGTGRVFHAVFDLEQLALVLATDRASFLRIAKDLGKLYREKSYLNDGEFDWFFASKGDRYRKSMERAAQKDEDIACFMEREQAAINAQEEWAEQRRENPTEPLSGRRLSRWLVRRGDEETVARLAETYRNQENPALRAEALKAFLDCAYPDDPQPILDDTLSECGELRRVAWIALKNIRHPAVRQFSMNNVEKGLRTPENLAILARNYVPRDQALLEELLRDLVAKGDRDDLHGVGLDIYDLFDKAGRTPLPKHLLPLLYEYNPCSCCREIDLNHMARYRMLTEKILEECQCDSSEDIRRFAKRRLKVGCLSWNNSMK